MGQWKKCYADYVDLDGDKIPELMTISIAYSENLGGDIAKLKVYGNLEEHAAQAGETEFDIAARVWELTMCEDTSKVPAYPTIRFSSTESSKSQLEYLSYYQFTDCKLKLVDEFYQDPWSVPEENRASGMYEEGWFSSGESITDTHYYETVGKYAYSNSTESGIFGGSYQTGTFIKTGILSEILGISVKVNGKLMELDVTPFLEEDNVIVPMQPILKEMGAAIYETGNDTHFLASTKRNTLEVSDQYYSWGDTSGSYYVNYDDTQGEFEPRVVNGQVLIPAKEMVETFGGKLSWDSGTRTLSITGSIPPADRMSDQELEALESFSLDEAIAFAKKAGYNYAMTDWDDFALYRNGKKYWSMFVVLEGTEFYYFDGETNAVVAEVANDGSLTLK